MCFFLFQTQDSYRELLEKMATYIQMMTGLDGYELAFGDSDSTETTEILSLSAVVFNSRKLLLTVWMLYDLLIVLCSWGEKRSSDCRNLKGAWQPKSMIFEDSLDMSALRIHIVIYFIKMVR